jgi:DNA-binding SARP family transcriptional activator/tetratricopeptide (TPR) repeat protein
VGEIKTAYPLIHNKVNSPHYVTPTLRRGRLIDWLNDHADCRAVVIAAEAGYGKTTLLWQWEQETDTPCYWYKLDRSDRDWSLQISYLIEAVSQKHPGFGVGAHSMLRQLGGPGMSRPGVAAYLLAEMHERLIEPCTFIVDDWQVVASQTEVRGLWNQILRDAPATCRFVFLSRSRPHLQFARLKTHGGYGELRTDALRFSEEEIEALFRDVYSDPLDADELAEVDRRTEGWAASLQLVEVSLRERQGAAQRRAFLASITASSDTDLFAFLAEEVLDQQTDETRNFLLCTAILQQITPELAERMTGVRDGHHVLSDLEQRGLFTNRLGDPDVGYRYHGLFRDFLERRLVAERSDAEVVGLHIHAASFYETTLQWPRAIHHYLKARLQRQAARLIAKYGEEVVAEGRLGLIDEWLEQLPAKAIHDNARLSLLHGEALGTIRGEWDRAIAALMRGRDFFVRKGDRRMVALADLKSSTHWNYRGETSRSADAAKSGLMSALEEDAESQLRLRGNLAITATWLESLDRTERECIELTREAEAKGLSHFAAIGHHNLGLVQQCLGKLTDSLSNFEEADRLWNTIPSSPFGDNSDFVVTLLALGLVDRAEEAAHQGALRTRNWPRPLAEAEYGRAAVLIHRGDFDGAARVLRRVLAKREILGGLAEAVLARLIGALFLGQSDPDEIEWASQLLAVSAHDPRLSANSKTAMALAAHSQGRCSGECTEAMTEWASWGARGARFDAACGRVLLAPLVLEHRPEEVEVAVAALSSAERFGAFSYLRWWLRPFVAYAPGISQVAGGIDMLLALAALDMQFWTPGLVEILPTLPAHERTRVIEILRKLGGVEAAHHLLRIPGTDVSDARRTILRRNAGRLYLRAFGPMTIHRRGWDGPEIRVEKRRLRLMLGLLVANRHRSLTREMALETLWPDHDPASAINNLNQAVFQLRRNLGGESRDPDRPQYILSSPDTIAFDPDLIVTDLDEVRQLARLLDSASTPNDRHAAASAMLTFIRGEFLADLRYEEWAAGMQMSVAAEIRQPLLQIAAGSQEMPPHLRLRAAEVLTEFDPFDESAQVAMARTLYKMGRRAAARKLITRFAVTIEEELQASPSPEVHQALVELAGGVGAVQ